MSDNHPLREDFISHLLLLCAVIKNNKLIFKLNGAMQIWAGSSVGSGRMASIYLDIYSVIPLQVAVRNKVRLRRNKRPDLLLVAILLLDLLNLLWGWPLPRWIHHPGHHGARHGTVAVSWGAHGWPLWSHTAGWGHAWSLQWMHAKISFIRCSNHQQDGSKKRGSDIVLKLTIQCFILGKQHK